MSRAILSLSCSFISISADNTMWHSYCQQLLWESHHALYCLPTSAVRRLDIYRSLRSPRRCIAPTLHHRGSSCAGFSALRACRRWVCEGEREWRWGQRSQKSRYRRHVSSISPQGLILLHDITHYYIMNMKYTVLIMMENPHRGNYEFLEVWGCMKLCCRCSNILFSLFTDEPLTKTTKCWKVTVYRQFICLNAAQAKCVKDHQKLVFLHLFLKWPFSCLFHVYY